MSTLELRRWALDTAASIVARGIDTGQLLAMADNILRWVEAGQVIEGAPATSSEPENAFAAVEAAMLRNIAPVTEPAPDAPEPHPPPPAPRSGPGLKWTPDRIAVLRAGWADCRSNGDILAAVNALPGEPLAPSAIGPKASELHLGKRGSISRDGHPSVTAGMAEEDNAVPMPWRDICEWARRAQVDTEDGASRDEDLARVNQARAEHGLPPFRVVPLSGRMERLAPERAIT